MSARVRSPSSCLQFATQQSRRLVEYIEEAQDLLPTRFTGEILDSQHSQNTTQHSPHALRICLSVPPAVATSAAIVSLSPLSMSTVSTRSPARIPASPHADLTLSLSPQCQLASRRRLPNPTLPSCLLQPKSASLSCSSMCRRVSGPRAMPGSRAPPQAPPPSRPRRNAGATTTCCGGTASCPTA